MSSNTKVYDASVDASSAGATPEAATDTPAAIPATSIDSAERATTSTPLYRDPEDVRLVFSLSQTATILAFVALLCAAA